MNHRQYSVEDFPSRLKALRIQKKYKSISAMSKEIGIIHQTLSTWETGNKTPTIKSLTKLLNFFNVDVRYFFPDNGKLFMPIESEFELPFIETKLSNAVSKFLDRRTTGVSVIGYPGNIGITRAIKEYLDWTDKKIKYFCGDYRSLQRYGEIIIDDADKLNNNLLDLVFNEKKRITLVGIDILDKLERGGYIKKIRNKLELQFIEITDFNKIMENALPDIPDTIAACIRAFTLLNLKALAELVKEIKTRQIDPEFKLDLDIVEAILT